MLWQPNVICLSTFYILSSSDNENKESKKRLNIEYIPLGAQGIMVKNITNLNALHFELLKTMHQIECCLARSLQARSLRQQQKPKLFPKL